MPRPPRRLPPGMIFHVLNRGNGRRWLFRKDRDFQAFVDILTEGLRRYRVDLLCWCLMGNHWHLVVRPRAAGELQRFMQWFTITHVRRHHQHYGAVAGGHLYQGRYKHFCVEADDHFLTLCRYVEANPRRAGLAKRAEQWRWSSLRQRQDRADAPPLTEWPVDRPADWLQLVNEPMPEREAERVRQCVARDRPLGSAAWTRRTAQRLGVAQTLNPRGRPRAPLETLSARQRHRRSKLESGQNGA